MKLIPFILISLLCGCTTKNAEQPSGMVHFNPIIADKFGEVVEFECELELISVHVPNKFIPDKDLRVDKRFFAKILGSNERIELVFPEELAYRQFTKNFETAVPTRIFIAGHESLVSRGGAKLTAKLIRESLYFKCDSEAWHIDQVMIVQGWRRSKKDQFSYL